MRRSDEGSYPHGAADRFVREGAGSVKRNAPCRSVRHGAFSSQTTWGAELRPNEADAALATRVAAQIARLGRGRVRQVAMIGSRAYGHARPDSDLDLVVLVELPPGSRPWNGEDFARAGHGLHRLLAHEPVKVDVRVRSTDRFAEAKDVAGGVEWLAAHEGVVVYDMPLVHPTTVRTSTDEVRREIVSAWMHHAIAAGERFDDPAVPQTQVEIAHLVIERLIAAALVSRRQAPRLDRDLSSYLLQLSPEPSEVASFLRAAIADAQMDPRGGATEATRRVLRYLSRDPLQARVLIRATQRLERMGSLS